MISYTIGARDDATFLEEAIGSRVALTSAGPRREETIVCDATILERWPGGRIERSLAARKRVAHRSLA